MTKTTTTIQNSEFSIVRCDRSGVFFGKIEFLDHPSGKKAIIRDVRNLHYWDGAASVLQLGLEGVKAPESCRFTLVVPEIIVTDVIQVVPCTKEAEKSLANVAVWKR